MVWPDPTIINYTDKEKLAVAFILSRLGYHIGVLTTESPRCSEFITALNRWFSAKQDVILMLLSCIHSTGVL